MKQIMTYVKYSLLHQNKETLKCISYCTSNTLRWCFLQISHLKYIKIPFAIIRSIINVRKEKPPYNHKSKNLENKTLAESLTTSNHLHNLYISVVQNLVKKYQKHLTHTLKVQTKTLFLSPITKEDVEDLLSTLRTQKSIDSSSLPSKVLKDFKKCFSKPISDLINLTFSFGIFPVILKPAKVLPIFEKGDQQKINDNYGPNYILFNISKIIEKLIHKQLYGFL